MTYTETTEIPDKNEFFIDHMNIAVEESTHEVTDRGFDSKRDEYHETTSELSSDTSSITCPLETMVEKSSGDEMSDDFVQEMIENGVSDVQRVDIDEVEYTYNGTTYIGTYDVSSLPSE